MTIVCFNVSDIFFVPYVDTSARLSYIHPVACVTFYAIDTICVYLFMFTLGYLFENCILGFESYSLC